MGNYEWIHFKEKTVDMGNYENFSFINSLRNQLTSIKNFHPLLESVHIHFPNTSEMYHSSAYAYGSFTVLDQSQNQQYIDLSSAKAHLQYYMDPISDNYALSLIMEPLSSAIDYNIILTLSLDTLQQSIADNCTYEYDYYYFSTGNDFALSNMEPEMKAEAVRLAQQMIAQNDHGTDYPLYQKTTIHDQTYYAFYYFLTYSGAYYVRLLPTSFLSSVISSSYIMIIIFCFAILSACILFLFGIYRMVHKPFTQLTKAFIQVEQGDFTVQTELTNGSDFNYVFNGFNHMVSQLNTLIEQNYTQTMLLQKAELKQLQAQINPHFLYNSFFMLQKMIRWDSEQAEEIANALARYFQYITRNSNDLVPLSAEYSHARDYIFIQELRFSGRIHIEAAELPEKYTSLPVPKLILQPVLENVFKHGLKNTEEHGLVQISFHPDQDTLKIVIEDNGNGLEDDTLNILTERLTASRSPQFTGEMTGILNIQKRLILFSHLTTPMSVFRSELGGLAVEITLSINDGL